MPAGNHFPGHGELYAERQSHQIHPLGMEGARYPLQQTTHGRQYVLGRRLKRRLKYPGIRGIGSSLNTAGIEDTQLGLNQHPESIFDQE